MRLSRTPAITLRTVDYSETSQVLRLYTRDHGKVHAIAKGSRRPKSSFPGGFDVMVLYDLIRLERIQGGLDIVTKAECLREFRGLRGNLGRFSAACYLVEFVDELTMESLPQPELFDLLEAGLDALDRGEAVAPVVFAFEVRALAILGFEPRTDECGLCHSRLSGTGAWFSPRDGGAVCLKCTPRDSARIRVRRPVLDAIAAYAAGRDFNLKMLASLPAELRRTLDLCVRHVAQREFKSSRFMRHAVIGRADPASRGDPRDPAPARGRA